MNKRIVAQLVAFSFSGVSLIAIAAGPPPDAGGGPMAGPGRQQVMPSIPHRDWHNGQRVPNEYRNHNFMLDDWRGHGLKAPPRGHRWLGINGDYVLVSTNNWAISTIVSGTQ
ncbi:RcnB family protein [Paraburkholderia susongensis]|uniref:Regulator RcnB of Ni and Co efflux n=1 Tax=Paraburkholderia susongensis TaxID=1515439 RepID=A0A1X7LK33_9BURK|nr:RcnB family protein [Paraburkholderia susongensis]SMG53897.1 regulator RcnB of Ni and Co efflux [Paraburkholderia susongensis]